MAEKKLQFKNENEYKEFLKKTESLSSKAEFQDALKNAKTPQEALEILLKFAPDVKDYVVEVDSNSQSELSDDDLENVAGGMIYDPNFDYKAAEEELMKSWGCKTACWACVDIIKPLFLKNIPTNNS